MRDWTVEQALGSAVRALGLPSVRDGAGGVLVPLPVSRTEIVIAALRPDEARGLVTMSAAVCTVPPHRRARMEQLLRQLGGGLRRVALRLNGGHIDVCLAADVGAIERKRRAVALIALSLRHLTTVVLAVYRDLAHAARSGEEQLGSSAA
jgi:hypothetical protein